MRQSPANQRIGDQARQQLQEPELDEAFGGRRHPEVAQARGLCNGENDGDINDEPAKSPARPGKFATASADCAASAFMAVLQK